MTPDAASDAPSRASPRLPPWRRLLPLLVGGTLFAIVLSRLDFATFTEALHRTNYLAFSAFIVAFSVALLVADVLASTFAYARTVGSVRFRDLFVIRGASYLPSILNHHVGQAWLTYFLAKTRGVSLARTAGATLFVYATTLAALFAFLLLGLPFNHGRVVWLMPVVITVSVAGVGYILAIAIRPRWLADRALLAPLFEAGVRGHLTAVAVRMPHMMVQFAGTWIPFLFFGVELPFVDALALLPVIMLAVTLPVSPQGLGTREALSIALLSAYATGNAAERSAVIAASTLSWLVLLTLVQLLLSLVFMRSAYRLLDVKP